MTCLRWTFLAVLATVLASTVPTFADDSPPPDRRDAPFGLQWLSPKEEVESLGVKLTQESVGDWGKAYVATALPKELVDQQMTNVRFGYTNKLLSIAAIGRSNDNDHYGAAGLARFNELASILTDKYGKGKTGEHTAQFYGDDRYAFGLAHGNNWKHITFDQPHMTLQLSLRAELNKTFWVIIAESKPGMAELKAQKTTKERESL